MFRPLLLAVAGMLMPFHPLTASRAAEEFAVVTAEHGYVLDADRKLIATLPQMTVVDVVQADGDRLKIRTASGTTGFLRQALVHRSSRFDYINDQNAAVIRRALTMLDEGNQAFNIDDDAEKALKFATEALTLLDQSLDTPLPCQAWIMAHQAYLQYYTEDAQAAEATLARALKLLEDTGEDKHLQAADVLNMRAILAQEAGRYRRAIADYQDSLLIVAGELGSRHHDMRVIWSNLASAYADADDTKQAVRAMRSAMNVGRVILPESAAERVTDLETLAVYLNDDAKTDTAVSFLKDAVQLRTIHHADDIYALADTRTLLGEYLVQSDQSDEAEAHFLAALADLQNESEEDAGSYTGMAHNGLGLVDFSAERFSDAESHFRSALRVMERVDTADDDSNRALVRQNLGDALAGQDRTQAAIVEYQRALKLFVGSQGRNSVAASELRDLLQELGSSDDPPGAMTPRSQRKPLNLNVVRESYDFMPDGESMLMTTRTVAVKDGDKELKRVPAGSRLWSFESRNGWHKVSTPGLAARGWVHESGVRDLGEVLVERLEARIVRENPNNPAVIQRAAAALQQMNSARVLVEKGDMRNAVATLEQALKTSDQAIGGRNILSAILRAELVRSYLNNSEYSKARPILESNGEFLREALGSGHPYVIQNAYQYAELLQDIGDAAAVETQMNIAVSAASQTFGPNDPRTMALQAERGFALSQLGRLDDAKETFEDIFTRETTRTGGVTLPAAECKLGVAEIAAAHRHYTPAARDAEFAMEAFGQFGDAASDLLWRSQFLAAVAYTGLGRYDDARQILKQGRESLKRAGTVDFEADSLGTMLEGYVALLENDLPAALQYAESSVRAVSAGFGSDHVNTYDARNLLAAVLSVQGNTPDAVRVYDEIRRMVRTYAVNTLVDLAPREQISFLQFHDRENLRWALSLSLTDSATQAAIDQTATWLLNSKNLSHEIAAAGPQLRRLLSNDIHRRAFDAWSDARKRLATLPATGGRIRDEEFRRLSSLEQTEFSKLPADVQAELTGRRQTWITVERVRDQLQSDEVLVIYMRIAPVDYDPAALREVAAQQQDPAEKYVAWIVPAAGAGHVQVVPLGDADAIDHDLVDRALVATEQSLKLISDLGEQSATEKVQQLYAALASAVWHPVRKELGDQTKIILSPDAELWRVPWAALPSLNDKLLLEEYQIRLSVSGRDVLQVSAPAVSQSEPLILADPAYDATTAEVSRAFRETVDSRIRSTRRSGQNERAPDPRIRAALRHRVARLPGTALEAQQVQDRVSTFAGLRAQVRLGNTASEAMFRTTLRPHTLMVSTHGFFVPRNQQQQSGGLLGGGLMTSVRGGEEALSPLQRCGLLLAGCNASAGASSDSDGILTGAEIVQTDLRRTELVVLSACETGIGEITSGEGVAGLRQAFHLAGAGSVISTLWQIEDRETVRLMTAFFENLAAGMKKPEALRQAQLKRIQARRNRNGAAHPFFWAAFTLSGR